MTEHPLYSTWEGMNQRCRNEKHAAYPYYGGRGISICERWKNFELFAADMGTRPDGYTLDRKNANGNYEPGNCRWATRDEQTKNQKIRSDNKSGLKGVMWFARTSRWMVYINNHGKRIGLGYYEDFFEACSVRKSAENKIWNSSNPDCFVDSLKKWLLLRPNAGNFKWRSRKTSQLT